ncbi:dynein light chain Tctex-type 1-like isoform 4-T4 [Salvelinus alpinus]|uniref:Dynein light chain Tctex-type 3 n=2 Tax=Salvelinus TaxID=8033 RepID=A0A8U1BUG6_SALNM|nr:dynein light chain Tctex-type 1-like isoform X1 [Salvelinus namaycush]
MEEYNSGEEVSFNADEASVSVKEMLDCVVFLADWLVSVSQCIEGIIGGLDYNQNKVNQWTASIVEHSLTQLVKQGRPFKFIVNCAIMQKSGAGLHTANSCYWDTATDGSCTVRWENRTMYCVV